MRGVPDLSLPESIPAENRLRQSHTSSFALYALCEITREKLESYLAACRGKYGAQVELPPRTDFSNESLRSIVEYHLDLAAQEGKFSGQYFIVCVYPNSDTVLLVTLDDQTEEFKPDLMWAPMDESGSTLVNLQISNTDWFEAKEQDKGGPTLLLERAKEAPDLSLPETIPENQLIQSEHPTPFALYALGDISAEKLDTYVHMCRGEYDIDIELPPKTTFSHQPLHFIIDYHLELAQGLHFDGCSFIVCVYPEATTVLLVTLDTGTEDSKPDLMWVPMEMSGLLLNNIRLGFGSWYEATKNYGVDDPNYPQERKKDPGFQIQLYAVEGVDTAALAREIHPRPEVASEDPSEQLYTIRKLPAGANDDASRHAAEAHPASCIEDPTALRNYFILADKPDFIKEGVELVHMDWDGITAERTPDQLRETGRNAPLQTQRADVRSDHPQPAFFTLWLIAGGHKEWKPDLHLFARYNGDYSEANENLDAAIDPLCGRRGHGRDRTVGGGHLEHEDLKDRERFWFALIDRHLFGCKYYRLEPRFVRQYLIWCGDKVPSAEGKVDLIKIDWDGDLGSTDRIVQNWRKYITKLEVVASEAYQLLSDVVDGQQPWDGVAIEE